MHTADYSYRSFPLVVTQFTLDKSKNGSHSIIYKVACCLLSLFLLHSLYLHLNVLGNLRTNVQDAVKMNCLGFPGGAVVKNPPANAGDMGLSPGPGRSHMPRSN